MAAGQGASLRELRNVRRHSSSCAALICQHATQERDEAIAAGMGKLLRQARHKAKRTGERARIFNRPRNGHAAGNAPREDCLESGGHAPSPGPGTARAGEGNRTLMTSLEGWGSTIELRPRAAPAQPVRAPASTSSRVAYRAYPVRRISGSGPCPPADRPGQVGYGRLSGMWRSLVSAPALGAGGREFESRHPDQTPRSQGLLRTAERLPRSFDRHLTVVLNASRWQ